jgi:predicted nucleotide-binding protein
MPSKKQSPPAVGTPTLSPQKGVELIERQIKAGNELTANGLLDDATYHQWESVTGACLEKIFGSNSPKVEQFLSFGKYGAFPGNAGKDWWLRWRAQNCRDQLILLAGFIEILKIDIDLAVPETTSDAASLHQKSRKVFVVHGHNDALRQSVARFLEKLELEPIILDEQANKGRTIFQKFQEHSDVAFVIVLLTGDDVGGKSGTPVEQLSFRARQNVILEFGYFLGKLGPATVCALYQPEVELPSDVSGIGYVRLDNSLSWKLKVAHEIKAAGIDIDLNRTVG